jgi:hypothetical protein
LFFLRFGDVLGERGSFVLGEVLVDKVRCGSVVHMRRSFGASFVARHFVMLTVLLVTTLVVMFRLGVTRFGGVFPLGSNLIERVRGVQPKLVVLSFIEVAFDFIHMRSGRSRRFVDRIGRQVCVRLPLRNRFARQRLDMRRKAAARARNAAARLMAETRTTAVARPTIKTRTTVEPACVTLLKFTRRLMFVLVARLRLLLDGFGRRRNVERIVHRLFGDRRRRSVGAVAELRNRFAGKYG